MYFSFDPNIEPLYRIKPGELFTVKTEDAACGEIDENTKLSDIPNLPSLQYDPVKTNPISGPIFVEGAKKGDLLVVHIEKIEVDDVGRACFWPSGQLGDSYRWSKCRGPYLQWIKHNKEEGIAEINGHKMWKLDPMIGTIGVAPEWEVFGSGNGQGPWGGNVDIRDIREGTDIFFNCYNDGGLLSLGDVHGSQGDTEFSGSADETKAKVTLRCEIIKNKKIPFFRLETEDKFISIYCERPLEFAVEKAIQNLMRWMVEEYGIDERVAYLYTGVNPEFRINVYQMLRTEGLDYTVGAELPKRYFKTKLKLK
jgi:acetamidase/formamidase